MRSGASDTGTRGRGDAETREDAETRGRGDAGKGGRGDAEMRNASGGSECLRHSVAGVPVRLRSGPEPVEWPPGSGGCGGASADDTDKELRGASGVSASPTLSPRARVPTSPRLLLLAVLLSTGCEKKAPPEAAARSFFEQIGTGKPRKAYGSAAFGFQASENERMFEAVSLELGITDYASLQAEAAKIQGRTATLRVEVTTHSGARMPFIITMTDEDGEWRIFSIRSPRDPKTGLSENPFSPLGKSPSLSESTVRSPPDEKEARRLVRENLVAFDEAVASRSFKAFYAIVSTKWQEQLTEGQLQRTFQPFVEQQFRLPGIREMDPVFDRPPSVNPQGILVLSGYYPTKPYQIVFSLKFMYELPKWKLFGIDLNLKN